MPQQEAYYRQLQKRVYEILYPERPITKNCEIGILGSSTIGKPPNFSNFHKIYKESPEVFIVFGEPLTLSNILRVLPNCLNTACLYKDMFYIQLQVTPIKMIEIKIDLSRKIKDQDQEVLEELYQLIK